MTKEQGVMVSKQDPHYGEETDQDPTYGEKGPVAGPGEAADTDQQGAEGADGEDPAETSDS
jgi:hypothetical protein